MTRFILVGVISNGVAFVAYLLLALVVQPIVAMTFLYAAGFIVSFIGNRSFTFNHTSALFPTVLRFTLMHLVLYALRYGMFDYFVTTTSNSSGRNYGHSGNPVKRRIKKICLSLTINSFKRTLDPIALLHD